MTIGQQIAHDKDFQTPDALAKEIDAAVDAAVADQIKALGLTTSVDETEFVEDLRLPTDFMFIVVSGRPEMAVAVAKDRTLNQEETRAVVRSLAALVKTNMRLRRAVVNARNIVESNLKSAIGNLQALEWRLLGTPVSPPDEE